MASTNYGTYRPSGTGDPRSMERLNWILAAVVLFLLSFFMSTGKDAEQANFSRSFKTFAYGLPRISQEPNGANYKLMSGHR